MDLTFDSHAAVPHLDLAGDAVAVEDDAGSVVSDPGATAVRRSSDSKRVTTSEDIVSPLQRRGSDSDLAVTTRGLLRSSSSRGSTSSHSVRTQLTPDAVGIPSSLSAVLRSQPVTPANITKSLSTIPNVPAANVLPDPPAIPPVTTAVDSTSSDSSESDSSSTTSGYSVISDTDSSDSKASGDSGDTVPFSAAGGDAVPARKRPSKGAKRSRRRVDEFDWLKMTESDYGSEFDTDQSSSSSSSSSTSSPVVNGGEEKEAEVLVASDGGDDVAMQSGDSVGMVDRIGTSGRLPSRRNRVGSDASDQRSIEERLEEGMMMHAVDANEMGQEAVVEEQHFPVRAADSHSEHTTVCCDAEDCDAEHHEVVNCPAPALTRNFSTMPPTPDGIHRSVSDSEYMREALRARVDDDLGQNIPGEQGPSPSPHHKHHHHHHRRLGRARSTIIYRVPFDDAVKRSELLDTESRSHASGSTTNNPRHFDDLPSDALLESTVYAPFTEDAMAVADTVLPSPNKESSQDGFPALTSAPTTDTSPVHSSPSKTMSSFELLRPSRTTSLAVRAVGFAEEHVDIMKKSSSAVEMRELLDHAAPQPATQSAPTHSHNRSSTRRSDQMKHVKRSLEGTSALLCCDCRVYMTCVTSFLASLYLLVDCPYL